MNAAVARVIPGPERVGIHVQHHLVALGADLPAAAAVEVGDEQAISSPSSSRASASSKGSTGSAACAGSR